MKFIRHESVEALLQATLDNAEEAITAMSQNNIDACDLLDDIETCPRCGDFVDIRFKACKEGVNCPILADCVGIVVLCPQCDEYNEVEKQETLQGAVKDWRERTRKYRDRGAYWQCGDCKHKDVAGVCTTHNDFSSPQWNTIETPDGEWARETRCRLYEEK